MMMTCASRPTATQSDDGTLDYHGLNITKEVMWDLAETVTGRREMLDSSQNAICDEGAACCLCSLHALMMNGAHGSGREEGLRLYRAALRREASVWTRSAAVLIYLRLTIRRQAQK